MIQFEKRYDLLKNNEINTLIGKIDWAGTSVGCQDHWPRGLCSAVDIILSMNQPAFLWWGTKHIQFFNDAYQQHFIDREIHPAKIGETAESSWGPLWPLVQPLVNKAFSGVKTTWTEAELGGLNNRQDQSPGGWTFSAVPLAGDGGVVSGVMVICNAGLRNSDGPAKKSADLFSIIDTSPEFISMMDTDGSLRYLNPTALRTLGWDSYSDATIWDAIYPEDRLHTQKIIDDTIANGFASSEVRFRNAVTGKPFWLKLNLVVNRDMVTNEITGLSSVSQNVTELRKMQRALIEGEARFRNIVAQSPIPIALTRGRDVVIESINEPMLYFMGKGGQNVIGKKMIEVLPELEHQAVLQIVKNILDTGEVFRGLEVPIKLVMDGELQQFYFNLTYAPLVEDGQITGVLHSASDVTHQVIARKKIEGNEAELQQRVDARTKELNAVNEELQRSNQQLEEFAYAASHDLKEPIRKIQIFTNRLKTQLESKLEAKELALIEKVEQASARMGTLIEDLLMYSHVSMVPHEKESVDLNEKVARAMEDLELKIADKNAVINVDPLPVVKGYKRQLQQLFQNLLSNAIKYSRPDISPEVTITSRVVSGNDIDMIASADYHHITVQDNGIGFETEHAEKIFQMFQRLHNNRQYEGTGVGLSIARKIVDNHQGKIIAESEPGKGARFHVFLPA